MSTSRFWGRGRDSQDEVGTPPPPPAPTWTLTALDRCDRCGAQAYVRVLLPSRLELLFCAHHTREHGRALAEIAVEIQDETRRLTRTAA